MKILHIADLHLGKKVGGYSLLEDQRYFLNDTIRFMNEKGIKNIIIAGDIYDISSPSGETISEFSNFLNNLRENKINAFIISGNHDSKDRVGYGSKLIKPNGIYINSNIKDAINPITVDDVNFYLIPYASAADINSAFDQNFKQYGEAFAYFMGQINIDKNKINIAVSHQLVLMGDKNPSFGGSEEPIIGTLQGIPSKVFEDFTYTALGHIHKPQNISDNIRYSGSPLAYHINECEYEKTYTIIDIDNGKLSISTEEIVPLRKVTVLKDTLDSIVNNYPNNVNDYIYAIITSDEVPNVMAILKNRYPYTIGMRYEEKSNKQGDFKQKLDDIENISYDDLFSAFYKEHMEKDLTEFQKSLVSKLLKEVSSDEA